MQGNNPLCNATESDMELGSTPSERAVKLQQREGTTSSRACMLILDFVFPSHLVGGDNIGSFLIRC